MSAACTAEAYAEQYTSCLIILMHDGITLEHAHIVCIAVTMTPSCINVPSKITITCDIAAGGDVELAGGAAAALPVAAVVLIAATAGLGAVAE